ncbi:MAG: alginate export family protein [Bacteroidota bacterium]
MKRFAFATVMLLLSAGAFCQTTLINGEIRPRFEFRDGYKKQPDFKSSAAYFMSQRTRLSGKYVSKTASAKITMQDVRVWGDEKLKTDVPGIGIYEAWAEVPLFDSLSLKAGRQELKYDNERLICSSNWQQGGGTHDALTLRYKTNKISVDLVSAFNQYSEATLTGTDYSKGSGNYKTLNILWVNKKVKDFSFTILGIADGYQKTKTTTTLYMRGTAGGTVQYKKDKMEAALRGYYQLGADTIGRDISAYFGSADFTYKLNKFSIIAGCEYISGNDAADNSTDENHAFSTLYGSGHTYNGNMDYFTDIPKDTKGAGLINPYLFFLYKCSDKCSMRIDFHHFLLQNSYLVTDNNGYKKFIDSNLGTEADFSVKYDFSKDVNLTFGYSAMVAQPSMEYISGGESRKIGSWGFIMLSVKPTFFKN